MPLLGLLELLIVDASRLEQSMPLDIRSEAPLQQLELPSTPNLEVLPFVIEGSVDTFDPVERAKELAQTISRKWCGTYRSFDNSSNFDVILSFSKIKPIGQMVALHGQLLIDGQKMNVRGNLHAKSNQIELIVDSNYLNSNLSLGGIFVGLDGLKSLIWNSPSLNKPGGSMNLNEACDHQDSKS